MKLKYLLAVIGLIATALVTTGPAQATPTFVGSFSVDGGGMAPGWWTNPPVYSGQEAAALLFGGLPSEYFISISPSLDPLSITHTAHYDGWGEPDTVFGEGFHFGPAGGYNSAPGLGSAWSAYVLDHNDTDINYVWKSNLPHDDRGDSNAPATPEPCSLALLGLGLPLLMRRSQS